MRNFINKIKVIFCKGKIKIIFNCVKLCKIYFDK